MATKLNDKTYESETGRQFKVVFSRNGNSYLVHNRECEQNLDDICTCAALAMHKALIGIAELGLLEEATSKLGELFRSSKAVKVYYAVFHLFCACILLDDEWELRLNQRSERKKQLNLSEIVDEYEVTLKQLNNPSETAATWNECKGFEQDVATSISHGIIKSYCRVLRKNNKSLSSKKPLYIQRLYNAFVKDIKGNDEKAIPALYEKLDYIRDRAIYRPSNVVLRPGEKAVSALTSNKVREEIDGLPSSIDLFSSLKKILISIKEDGKYGIKFWYYFTIGSLISDCTREHLEDMGYTWENAEKLRGDRMSERLPTPSYQLVELFSPDVATRIFNKYWEPLFCDDDWR